MSEYSEIPGIYTESPRRCIRIRRWFRHYGTAIIAFIMLVFIIALASGISVLISNAVNPLPPPPPSPSPPPPPQANHSLEVLFALPWPRRDDHWYTARWSPRVTNGTHSLPIPPEAPPDGSTFPQGDTWHWGSHPNPLPPCRDQDVSEALARGTAAEEERTRIEDEMEARNMTLERDTPEYRHQEGFRKTSPLALKMARLGYAMNHATLDIKHRLNLSRWDATFSARWIGNPAHYPHCDPNYLRPRPSPCGSSSSDGRGGRGGGGEKYRRVDGSCNNVKHPLWGASFTPFRRMVPSDYSDGVMVPRGGEVGASLPSARVVSLGVHTSRRVASRHYTVLLMSWGQLVDHDITLTAQSKGKNGSSITCCHQPTTTTNATTTTNTTSTSTTPPPPPHHPECLPIPVPPNDPLYRSPLNNVSCLEFTRSAPFPHCHFGPRDQFNQQTSFLDGSVVYGASPATLAGLRARKNGLLKAQVTLDGRELLPPSLQAQDGCNKAEEYKYDRYCFKAGDPRVNEQLLLTSLHTVLARTHNIIATQLTDLNPHWDDEKTFEEARRILVAQIQHITYNEYLTSILGARLARHLGLAPQGGGQHSPRGSYDPSLPPGIANEFAAAAFRFGHSQVQGLVQQIDGPGKNIDFTQLSSITFNPFSLYDEGSMANYIRGEIAQKAGAVDTYFTPQLTGLLFRGSHSLGIDLVAVNIQRGRDHGLPPYTRMCMACGLEPAGNFSDLASDMDGEALSRIQTVYKDVSDVDLYTGGLAERPIQGGLVGPTFACIIADQFIRLKKADRYWYETQEQPQAFTTDQLAAVHKSSLARLLCDSVGELHSVQRWPLRAFTTGNPRLPCSSTSIPHLNLQAWEEQEEEEEW